MISMALAAVLALAPADRLAPDRQPARGVVASLSARRTRRLRASSPPELSILPDPYRSEASMAPPRVDPRHPVLAPAPDEAGSGDGGLAPVSPVPPDPWAPSPPPPDPLRPPGAEG